MTLQLLPTPAESLRPAATAWVGLGTWWQRLTRGVRHFQARDDWEDFAGADWRDRILDVPVTDCFHAKQGRSTGRWILEREGRRLPVYLKRHYRLPWLHGLLATLWPRGAWSPGMRERLNLLEAAAQGLPVPKVVAAGEWIGPGAKLQSFLAIEELVGMRPLHEAIPMAKSRLDAPTFRRWKNGLIDEMARLARLLHDRHWFHKDLYLCHYYIAEDDTAHAPACWQGRVFLIDLHRLGRHPWTWPMWLLKDLGGLLFSSDPVGVTARDRLRFWRSYCESKGGSWGERAWAWSIRRKAGSYQRHNAKHSEKAPNGVL